MDFKKKALNALALRASRTRIMSRVEGIQDRVEVFNLKGERTRLTIEEARSFEVVPLQWVVGFYFLCKGHDGKDYIKGEEIRLPYPMRQSLIWESLSEYHYNLERKLKVVKEHLLTYAWTATTCDKGLPEAVVMEMFKQSGAFEEIVPQWEQDS